MLDFSVAMMSMKKIHYWADLAPWIDFVVLVNEKDYETAEEIVNDTMDRYWMDEECEDLCYGDMLKAAFKEKGIGAVILFHSSDEEDDEYEDEWNKLIDIFEEGE